MKRRLLTLSICLMIAMLSFAHDFEVAHFYYKITSSTEPYTVAVTYKGDYPNQYGSSYGGNVIIPESVSYNGKTYSVTTIEQYAFNSPYLRSVTIPNSVTTIEQWAFSGSIGLTSVTIPNSVTSIGGSAFRDCSGLTSVTIPNSVTSIEAYAFNKCKALTSVTIPNSVTTIEENTFAGCYGLTSVVIPNSVTTIGNSAFNTCGLTSVVIPNSVTTIEAHAFDYCKNLTSITIPNSVTTIEESTFASCSGLTSVVIPTGVTSIGKNAFYNCKALTSVVIPNNVTTIGSNAFRGCNGLTSITIGNSVTSIGDYACEYCRALTEIKSYIQKPFATSSNCWNNVDKSIPLYVPYGTKEMYQNTDGWKEFTNIIEMNGPYVVGDISGDNVVDVSDYTGIANFIHGNPPAGFNEKAADVDKNGTVDVSDYTGIANIIHTGSIYGNSSNSARATGNQLTADWDAKDNVIFIAPFTATAGTKTAISIEMKNTAAIRGFQFDLYLPEGMTVVKSAKGKIQGKLSEGRLPDEDEHDLTFSQQADGAIRFLCSSQYDETFTGTSGELATLQVEIASDMANGDHAIQLKNMKLTETDISKYYTSDLIESTVTIEGGATMGIIAIDNDQLTNTNEAGAWYTIDGRRLTSRPAKAGLYIHNGKKVVIK